MKKAQRKYICKSDGFGKKGFTAHNSQKDKDVTILQGDIVESDSQGYLWKDGICICHKDSILGRYHFKKF